MVLYQKVEWFMSQAARGAGGAAAIAGIWIEVMVAERAVGVLYVFRT
jgi:hypothetical protein